MPVTLKQEIDAITAGRLEVERENPGFFLGRRQRLWPQAHALGSQVFGINYDEFPHMTTVWELRVP